ncbi:MULTISPECIES: fumarylacetoacetate hydrolase family protein [Klebsiella/Raoultella group]|uniref:fumarylacetoacetate hydrolase family protein n=1 Tax=Klebsiella/Raoultella group TaxID=2890311 RepID=UPI0015A74616|nr:MULTISPECIES: fumarylacetoacetate hydrolase family protein [Klebsiella/Raoultella group]MCS5990882.1 fumarylacetoacetate hydrolase family protein [Klebsiella variicola subsp. variicola]QLK20878.1 hypothetical protein GPJ66_08765 [Raoultella ornithinolytica]
MKLITIKSGEYNIPAVQFNGNVYSLNDLITMCAQKNRQLLESIHEFITIYGDGLKQMNSRFHEAMLTGVVEPIAEFSRVKLFSPVNESMKIIRVKIIRESHKGYQFTSPNKYLSRQKSIYDPDSRIALSSSATKNYNTGAIGVVIGRPCRNVREDDVLRHVAGITLLNFILCSGIDAAGKHFATSSNETGVLTAGPMIVTLDENTELNKISIQARRNGQTDSNLKNLTFPLKEIISYVSVFSQLNAGDIIATTFWDRPNERLFTDAMLTRGDILEIRSDQIGHLVNKIHLKHNVADDSIWYSLYPR